MPLASSHSYNSSKTLTHFFISMEQQYSDQISGKSLRRELQGPRPTPLKVRKDSHKIKKPPVFPQQSSQQQQQQQQQQQALVHRPPVIIYMVSPKIIHATPNEFMQLVQRLTGPNSSSSPVSNNYSTSSFLPQNSGGTISPAARFASLEQIKSPRGKTLLQENNGEREMVEGIDLSADIDIITGMFPGILSPGPSSLQPVPPIFFSAPILDQNPVGFFHDLSPVLHSNRNFFEGSFMPTPSNNFLFPNLYYSPTPSLDIFNNFFDH